MCGTTPPVLHTPAGRVDWLSSKKYFTFSKYFNDTLILLLHGSFPATHILNLGCTLQ
jgi:hypothetical protein